MVSAASPCSASSSGAAATTPLLVRPARWPGLRRASTLQTVQRSVKLYDVQLSDAGARMSHVALFHSVLGARPGMIEAAERLRAAGHEVKVVDQYDGRVFD